MKVQELFEEEKIEFDLIEERDGESEYWASCFNFIADNWEKELVDLSFKQIEWTHKILEDMIEYRIKESRRNMRAL